MSATWCSGTPLTTWSTTPTATRFRGLNPGSTYNVFVVAIYGGKQIQSSTKKITVPTPTPPTGRRSRPPRRIPVATHPDTRDRDHQRDQPGSCVLGVLAAAGGGYGQLPRAVEQPNHMVKNTNSFRFLAISGSQGRPTRSTSGPVRQQPDQIQHRDIYGAAAAHGHAVAADGNTDPTDGDAGATYRDAGPPHRDPHAGPTDWRPPRRPHRRRRRSRPRPSA